MATTRYLRGHPDGADFDIWFRCSFPRVVQIVRRLTGGHDDAEEIAAEAFARAFASWEKVGALEYRDAWVTRVAANLAVDLTRRRSRRRRYAVANDAPVADLADGVARNAALVASLGRLSRSQREVTVLRYLADLPEQDVAATLGLQPGTVKSHLHRALIALRLDLSDDSKEHQDGPDTV